MRALRPVVLACAALGVACGHSPARSNVARAAARAGAPEPEVARGPCDPWPARRNAALRAPWDATFPLTDQHLLDTVLVGDEAIAVVASRDASFDVFGATPERTWSRTFSPANDTDGDGDCGVHEPDCAPVFTSRREVAFDGSGRFVFVARSAERTLVGLDAATGATRAIARLPRPFIPVALASRPGGVVVLVDGLARGLGRADILLEACGASCDVEVTPLADTGAVASTHAHLAITCEGDLVVGTETGIGRFREDGSTRARVDFEREPPYAAHVLPDGQIVIERVADATVWSGESCDPSRAACVSDVPLRHADDAWRVDGVLARGDGDGATAWRLWDSREPMDGDLRGEPADGRRRVTMFCRDDAAEAGELGACLVEPDDPLRVHGVPLPRHQEPGHQVFVVGDGDRVVYGWSPMAEAAPLLVHVLPLGAHAVARRGPWLRVQTM